MSTVVKAIGLAATTIGVITGVGTIVGTLVSDKTLWVVARTAVGYAGMASFAVFAIGCVVIALLPPRRLRTFIQSGNYSGLLRRPLVARAAYLLVAVGAVLVATDEGLDPKRGYWLAIGASVIGIGLYAAVATQRERRRGELQECPDCAETVKAKARVCRYCGYRFLPPLPQLPPPALDD